MQGSSINNIKNNVAATVIKMVGKGRKGVRD